VSAADQLSRIAPYINRAIEDEYVQDQIGQAIRGLRRSSRRARRHSVSDAITDRRLRNQLGEAFDAFAEAGRALTQPPPKRHPIRRAVVLILAAAAIAFAWQKRSNQSPQV
jgi:hypothetical protein